MSKTSDLQPRTVGLASSSQSELAFHLLRAVICLAFILSCLFMYDAQRHGSTPLTLGLVIIFAMAASVCTYHSVAKLLKYFRRGQG